MRWRKSGSIRLHPPLLGLLGGGSLFESASYAQILRTATDNEDHGAGDNENLLLVERRKAAIEYGRPVVVVRDDRQPATIRASKLELALDRAVLPFSSGFELPKDVHLISLQWWSTAHGSRDDFAAVTKALSAVRHPKASKTLFARLQNLQPPPQDEGQCRNGSRVAAGTVEVDTVRMFQAPQGLTPCGATLTTPDFVAPLEMPEKNTGRVVVAPGGIAAVVISFCDFKEM